MRLTMIKRIFTKLTSFKNILTLWSVGMITYIVSANRVDWNNVSMALVAIPLSYFAVNIIQKKIKEEEEH